MEEPRMLSVAPSHVYVSCHFDWRYGWECRVSMSADERHDPVMAVYGPLSTQELVDTVASAIEAITSTRLEVS